jgi:hypothetical protein
MENSTKDKKYLDYIVYHRYIASKREFIESEDGKIEQIVYVSSKKAFQKDIYHFYSYKIKTFSTFFTGLTFWDSQAEYYRQGREVAKRLNEFVRVFLVENIHDLKRLLLKEQIMLDFKSGIKVYLCMFDKVKDFLPEPDFGMWDDKYLCIVPFGSDKNVKDIRITNRKEELVKAKSWNKTIMKYSVEVNDPDKDVTNFINRNNLTF